MFEFAGEVEVVPWRDEFAIADRNPEILETIEDLDRKLRKGLITEEEYHRELEKLPRESSSRTEGISFIEEKKVSFRKERPELWVVIHELGHVFFRERDDVWNAKYGGGETLLWLIVKGKMDGDENTVKAYMNLLKDIKRKPEKVKKVLNEAARRIGEKFNLPFRNALGLCVWSGCIPGNLSTRINFSEPQNLSDELGSNECYCIIIDALEGTRYDDFLWKEYLKEIISLLQAPDFP